MKKMIAILLGLTLSVSVLASAKAVEITGDMPGVWWANTSTNGNTSAAYWDIWNYENQNYDNYFVFNFDGTDDGWSEPVPRSYLGIGSIDKAIHGRRRCAEGSEVWRHDDGATGTTG